MDIRDWPLNRIMQLPDCCFGRRFPVFVSVHGEMDVAAWDISEVGLPAQAVLWEVTITQKGPQVTPVTDHMRLALGDQLPTTTAMMDALEPLLPGFGTQGAEPRSIETVATNTQYHMKKPVNAMGRRVVAEATPVGGLSADVTVCCVFSSIPTEVPDCLLSG